MSELLKTLKQGERTHNWILENLSSLKENYPGEFVAVRGDEIKAHAPDQEKIIKKLDSKGVNRSSVIIKYIHEKDALVLR